MSMQWYDPKSSNLELDDVLGGIYLAVIIVILVLTFGG